MKHAPTDNLYKFITFLGIALLIFCAWTTIETQQRISENIISAELATVRANRVVDSLELRSDGASRLTEQIIANIKAHPPVTEDDHNALTAEAKIVLDYLEALKADFSEHAKEQAVAAKNADDARILFDSSSAKLWWLFAGMTVGSVMTLGGFFCWYWLHQRHQDRLLSLQIEQARELRKPDHLSETPV